MRLQTRAVAYLLLLATSGAARAEDAPTLKRGISSDAVQFETAYSPDSQAVTMTFSNLLIHTETGRGTLPIDRTKKFIYVLEPESSKEVYITQDFRGFVSTSGSGSASLVIHSGGTTTVVDLQKAIEEADGNYNTRIETRVPAGHPLQTTVFLLVDRLPGDDDSSGHLTVDSIDAVVNPLPAEIR